MIERRVPVHVGLTLNLLEWPGRADPGFLLVHGLASNARMWTGVAEELAASGFAVAAVDLRGHGRSGKPEEGYDVDTVAADLGRVLDDLGWHRPVLAGQSWGGNVVLQLAADHPDRVRGVVGVDGGDIELAARFPDWEACAHALAPPHLAGLAATEFEAMVRSSDRDWPESGIAGFLANVETRADGTVAPWLSLDRHMQVLRGLWEHRPSIRYASLKTPVLFLAADDSTTWVEQKRQQLERVAAMLPRCTVTWMRGDHDLHAQHPGEVADEMLAAVTTGFFA